MGSGKNEKLLIKKIQQGDENAFEIVFLKYYTPLCKYIIKYIRSGDLAEEIVQEVFTIIWESRGNLDSSGHLRGLLYETARNKALDYIKHQKVVKNYIAQAKLKTENSYINTNFIENDDSAFIEAVSQAIQNLSPRAREIYKLNRDEGLTYKEISNYLDISIKTVESHMRRVLQILRAHLSKYVVVFALIILQIL